MVPITWDKIGMKNLTKRSFFSTSTKTVPINMLLLTWVEHQVAVSAHSVLTWHCHRAGEGIQ